MKGSVYRRGAKWYYKFRLPQRDPSTGQFPWVTKGGYDTERDAWEACRKAMRDADRNRIVRPSQQTVGEFVIDWLTAVKPALDASTWRNWSDYARWYVIPHIGGERLQALNEPVLLQFYAMLLAKGRVKPNNDAVMYTHWAKLIASGKPPPTPRELSTACGTSIHAARDAVRRYKAGLTPRTLTQGLAPKTVRNIHSFLHRALADAVAWKYISENPASNVKPPRNPRTRRHVWKPEEIRTFLASAREDRFAALFLLELTTGIRRGQICGLKWSAVDLDAGKVTVHDNRVVVGGQVVDKAGGKTSNADQTISIDKTTVSALRRWRAQQDTEREFFGDAYHPGDFVFTYPDGRPPHPDSIRQRFERLTARAGLSRITFHDLRHTYATGALRAGVSPKIVSERIGHANIGFFLETYAHVLDNDDSEAAEQAASFLLGDSWTDGDDAPANLPPHDIT